MRFEAQLAMLGMNVRQPGEQNGLAHGARNFAVIRVAVVVPPGEIGHHDVGPVLANQQNQLRSNLLDRRRIHIVVAPVQADDAFHSQVAGGLLGLAQVNHVVMRIAVPPVFFIVGYADIVARPARVGQFGNQPAMTVGPAMVVVMGMDHEEGFSWRKIHDAEFLLAAPCRLRETQPRGHHGDARLDPRHLHFGTAFSVM